MGNTDHRQATEPVFCLHCGAAKVAGVCPRCDRVQSSVGWHGESLPPEQRAAETAPGPAHHPPPAVHPHVHLEPPLQLHLSARGTAVGKPSEPPPVQHPEALQPGAKDRPFPSTILGIPVTAAGLRVLIATVLGALLIGSWLLGSRRWFPPPREEAALPAKLHEPPSSGRAALVSGIDQLDELAGHAQRLMLDNHDSSPATLAQLTQRLDDIDRFLREAKPGLNPEERRVARAVEAASKQLRAFVASYGTKIPDLDGTYAQLARKELRDARVLLMGGPAESPRAFGQ